MNEVVHSLKRSLRLAGRLSVGAILATALWRVTSHRAPTYAERLKDYHPDPRVAALARDANLTLLGQQVLYLGDPRVSDRVEINRLCSPHPGGIYGCYDPGTGRIFLYDLGGSSADGIMESAAAHEMLHAAFDAMTAAEKQAFADAVGGMTAWDPEVARRLALYKGLTPNQRLSEVHSIIGTEQATLTPTLEAYYARYFYDRSHLVALSRRHAAEVDVTLQSIAEYDGDLARLKAQIKGVEGELRATERDLRAERDRMQTLTADPAAYDAAVAPFNARVTALRTRAEDLQSLIDRFNQRVAQRNRVVDVAQDRSHALDSSYTGPVDLPMATARPDQGLVNAPPQAFGR